MFSSLTASPGAKAHYDPRRSHGDAHIAAQPIQPAPRLPAPLPDHRTTYKLRQDATVVEYEFGETPTSTDRRLLIDLPTMPVRPLDGLENINFDACARRISVLFGQTGSWPETGSVQS